MAFIHTTADESVEEYIKVYGFCHWQAQEVIKQRDALRVALQDLIGANDSVSDLTDLGDAYYHALQVLRECK